MTNIRTSTVTYEGPSGEVSAYQALPEGDGPFPGLLIIHEVFGITDWIRKATDRFAEAGYACLAPDLYTGDEVRAGLTVDDIEEALKVMHSGDVDAALAGYSDEAREKLGVTMGWVQGCFTSTTFLPDLQAGLATLQARDDVGTVGVMGWCMGGGLSGGLLASGADLGAGAIWYGPPPPLDQVGNVTCPVQGHYGGADPLTGAVPALQEAFESAGGSFEVFVYDGADHAFGNDTRYSYDADAAEQAWSRTIDFFDANLK